jgi:hypothetical protein
MPDCMELGSAIKLTLGAIPLPSKYMTGKHLPRAQSEKRQSLPGRLLRYIASVGQENVNDLMKQSCLLPNARDLVPKLHQHVEPKRL